MNTVGRYIGIALAVILILLFPLQYIAQSQSETIDSGISVHTAEFADTVRHQGFITVEQYEEFMYKLDQTGELYDVVMDISHPVTGKEIADQTIGDKIPNLTAENTSLKGIKKMSVSNTGSDNNIHSKGEITSFAVHTHTDDCYSGHRHTSDCIMFSKCCNGMKIGYTFTPGYEYSDASESRHTILQCASCGTKHIEVWTNDYYDNYGWGDKVLHRSYNLKFQFNKGEFGSFKIYTMQSIWLKSGSDYIYKSGNKNLPKVVEYLVGALTDTSSPYYPIDLTNYPTGTNFFITIDSLYDRLYKYDGFPRLEDIVIDGKNPCGFTQDDTVDCDKVVTSITAISPIQTVNLGDEMETSALATYLDGHTGVVNCTTDFNPNILGTQNVTLTYKGLVDNAKTEGEKTCSVTVTVKEPYLLTDITVTPENQDVQRYKNPKFTVTAHYDNNTSKTVSGYTVTGFINSKLGLQKLTIKYTESGITKTADVYVTVKNMTKECPDCGTVYELDENDKDPGCPVCNGTIVSITANPSYIVVAQGDPIFLTVEAVYKSGIRSEVTGWTSNYDPNQIGIQDVKISYEGFETYITVEVINNKKTCPECGVEYKLNEDGLDPGCPLCKQIVVSLEVNPNEVTIEKHQPLPVTVTAHFKDGHTEEVTDWTTNFIADTSGTFDATIIYNSAFTTIRVTVLDDGMVDCPYCGLNYKFSDSPKGCPVCYYQLTGIEAKLRNGGNTVPYKSDLNLEIILVFRDEHRETTYEGWSVSGYDPNTLGLQTITVMYEGFSTELEIEVVDDLPEVICPNGHIYYLNEDGSDPGCPYCDIETNKENVILYFDTVFTKAILEKLYQDGIYYLQKGDYFTITVTPKNKSLRSNIQKMFFGANQTIPGKRYTFGGEVIY